MEIPKNIEVMCVCGKIFRTAITTKEEEGFVCDCGRPIASPLNEENDNG